MLLSAENCLYSASLFCISSPFFVFLFQFLVGNPSLVALLLQSWILPCFYKKSLWYMHNHSQIYQKYEQICHQITFLDSFQMPWETLYIVTRWKHCVSDRVFMCDTSEKATRFLVTVRVETLVLFRSATTIKNAIVALLYIRNMSLLLVPWTRWGIEGAVWHWLGMKAISDLLFSAQKDNSDSKFLILSTTTFQLVPWLLLSITSALIVLAFLLFWKTALLGY